jgi:hypothetical protein
MGVKARYSSRYDIQMQGFRGWPCYVRKPFGSLEIRLSLRGCDNTVTWNRGRKWPAFSQWPEIQELTRLGRPPWDGTELDEVVPVGGGVTMRRTSPGRFTKQWLHALSKL